jgi:membrane protease subunit HflC
MLGGDNNGENATAAGRPEKPSSYSQAQEVKGKADAEATRIYAQAYSVDADFYQFLKTLETYRTSLDSETWLLLSTDSEFFKFLKGSQK